MKLVLSAMLDSGSPISMIQESLIPTHVRDPNNDHIIFVGLNQSRLKTARWNKIKGLIFYII